MENNSTFAEKRSFLEKRSEKFKSLAKGDVLKLKGNMAQVGKTALIVGGSVLGAYLIYKMLFGKREFEPITTLNTNNNSQPVVIQRVEEESTIVKRIKEQIALFLVGIAKQKLQEYLDSLLKKTNE